MRISDNMAQRDFLRNIEVIKGRLYERSLQVSSGKKLNRPSQDPQGSGRVLRIRDQVLRISQYSRNINQARLELSSADSVLNSLRNLSTSVIESVQQGLSDTNQAQRDIIATEIEGILQDMVHLSATSIDGKRIFSGSATSTDPILLSAGVYIYQGDSQARMVEIAEGRQIQLNVLGSDIFTDPSSDLLNTVQQLADALRISDTATATSLLTNMDAAMTALDSARATVGITLNQMEGTQEELDLRLLTLAKELSNIEDADMIEAISALTQTETALAAALEAGVRIRQPTLLDFLG